jgi:hypothetical protein
MHASHINATFTNHQSVTSHQIVLGTPDQRSQIISRQPLRAEGASTAARIISSCPYLTRRTPVIKLCIVPSDAANPTVKRDSGVRQSLQTQLGARVYDVITQRSNPKPAPTAPRTTAPWTTSPATPDASPIPRGLRARAAPDEVANGLALLSCQRSVQAFIRAAWQRRGRERVVEVSKAS